MPGNPRKIILKTLKIKQFVHLMISNSKREINPLKQEFEPAENKSFHKNFSIPYTKYYLSLQQILESTTPQNNFNTKKNKVAKLVCYFHLNLLK